MTVVPNWLIQRSQLTPGNKALTYKDNTYSYQELHELVLKRANKLSALGIKKRDVVAIFQQNSVDMLLNIHALRYIGALKVLLNTRLSSHELEWQVKDSKATYLLVDDSFSFTEQNVPVYNNSLVEATKENTCEVEMEFSLDDIDTIMYTSGTTGKPKGVMQTYGNHWWSANGSLLNLGLQTNDCWLTSVPLFHISGLSIVNRSVIYGIPMILMDKFDPVLANTYIMQKQATIMSVVSTMLKLMLEHLNEESYPNTFRCMLLGGGPAPKPLLDACIEKAIPVIQTYGMTETASQVTTLSPQYMFSKLGSAGKPLFPNQIKILSEGKEQEPHNIGEIVVKGPNVTCGYWQRDDATLRAFIDEWLYTGDLGYKDEDGFLYVVDRRSDLIISGGENIYPAEIEAALLSIAGVAEAGVTGMNDTEWGKVPYAFVVMKPGCTFNEYDIRTNLQQQLAKYKMPNRIFCVKQLPRNASNKLMRHELLKLIIDIN
ncbi:o-succinylbenzoate--CoA ligase [Bacillus sp. HMF5848]|uniref:o-succinylbenzoate--CoA ligase n=1 Tax=Bacillus sp. HMF5848 TaxID=2495421 RepID=UPI000F78AE33|nr:o-succinylbenzoate--CoA ligase [Bacillus sp. HMF5848]RSK28277.1 o-succinylbenzoate--CoA ligase [Bacillus sp. HMF5848]